jgi:hypothetical protein
VARTRTGPVCPHVTKQRSHGGGVGNLGSRVLAQVDITLTLTHFFCFFVTCDHFCDVKVGSASNL